MASGILENKSRKPFDIFSHSRSLLIKLQTGSEALRNIFFDKSFDAIFCKLLFYEVWTLLRFLFM